MELPDSRDDAWKGLALVVGILAVVVVLAVIGRLAGL
jgi:hypothetical protein